MSLTLRQDGSQVGGQPNTVVASWWNDFYDLLSGLMTDTDVSLHTDLLVRATGPNPTAPSAAAQAGSGLGIGTYQYAVTFVKQGQSGESSLGTSVSVTTTSGNQAVGLSALPTGVTGTIARNIYRTKVGGSSFYYVAQISNNTTLTYLDTTADSSLTTAAPTLNNFGGRLIVKDGNGAINAWITCDGNAEFDGTLQANAFTSTHNITLGLVGSGASWVNAIEFITSGTPTVSHNWALNYNGANGALLFYDNTTAKTVLQIPPSGIIATYPNGLSGTMASLGSAGGGASGVMVWEGTTDPGGASGEGDLWAAG